MPNAIIRGLATNSSRRRELWVVKRVMWSGENASPDCSATIIVRPRDATQYVTPTTRTRVCSCRVLCVTDFVKLSVPRHAHTTGWERLQPLNDIWRCEEI